MPRVDIEESRHANVKRIIEAFQLHDLNGDNILETAELRDFFKVSQLLFAVKPACFKSAIFENPHNSNKNSTNVFFSKKKRPVKKTSTTQRNQTERKTLNQTGMTTVQCIWRVCVVGFGSEGFVSRRSSAYHGACIRVGSRISRILKESISVHDATMAKQTFWRFGVVSDP